MNKPNVKESPAKSRRIDQEDRKARRLAMEALVKKSDYFQNDSFD
jgi:hypothetical protein